MATTRRQDEEFVREVVGLGLLETAIDWIEHNLNPEDVFNENQLNDWAKKNYEEED